MTEFATFEVTMRGEFTENLFLARVLEDVDDTCHVDATGPRTFVVRVISRKPDAAARVLDAIRSHVRVESVVEVE